LRGQEFADFGEEFCVIGDDGEGIAFRAENWFGQATRFRE
jgi:hypothetical protein